MQPAIEWIKQRPEVAFGAPLGAALFVGSATNIIFVASHVELEPVQSLSVIGTLELLMGYAGWEMRTRKSWGRFICLVVLLLGATAILVAGYAAAGLTTEGPYWLRLGMHLLLPAAFLGWLVVLETRPARPMPRAVRSRPPRLARSTSTDTSISTSTDDSTERSTADELADRRAKRTDDQLRAELAAAIKDERLPQDPSAEQARQVLGIAWKRANQLLKERAPKEALSG